MGYMIVSRTLLEDTELPLREDNYTFNKEIHRAHYTYLKNRKQKL